MIITLTNIYIIAIIVMNIMFLCSYCIRKSNKGVDTTDDAGVSKAMSTIFNLQGRMNILLVHGILHLLGFVLSVLIRCFFFVNINYYAGMTTKKMKIGS